MKISHIRKSLFGAVLSCIAFAATAGQAQAQAAASTAGIDNDGFIQRWTILDPISVNGLNKSAVRASVEREYFPAQLSVLPKDGDKVTINGNEHVWRSVSTANYNVNLYFFADGNGKPTSNVLFWCVTIVDCPEAVADARLAIGSNAASVWWVNGQEVIGIYNDRQTVIDDGVSKRLALKKGRNIIRAAILNAGGATDFCARILDANDNPLKTFSVVSSGQ